MKALMFVLFVTLMSSAYGQVADMAVSVEFEGENLMPPNSLRRIRLTLKNNGPQAKRGSIVTFYDTAPGNQTLEMVSVPETECRLFADDLGSVIGAGFFWLPLDSQLQPGASQSCIVGLRIAANPPAVFTQRFSNIGIDDPDLNNNSVEIVIRTIRSQELEVKLVPALTEVGTYFFILATLTLGVWSVRRL